MMDLRRIQHQLDYIEYKPGWKLEVYETEAQGLWIAISAELENSYEPGTTVPICVRSPLPPFKDGYELLVWVRQRLERIEVHECHEWLRDVRTHKPFFDPHDEKAILPK